MEFRIGITGHRPNKLPCQYDWDDARAAMIRKWMRGHVFELKNKPGTELKACTGMALGADLFFAAVCYWEDVPFKAFCPCWGQENKWPTESQDRYMSLLRKAEEIIYVHNGPYPGPQCMLERNQAMVDWLKGSKHSLLLAIWNGDLKGGTADAIKRAKQAGLEILVLDPSKQE